MSLERKHYSFDPSASELNKDLFDVGIDAGIHVYLLYQDNLSFLPVISVEQTTLSNNGEQVLKLTTCTGLAELSVKHTIKCLFDTRCKRSSGDSKGCKSSWSITATTEQISLWQTALGSTLFLLSSKQIHAVYAAFQRQKISPWICNRVNNLVKQWAQD